MHQHRCHLEGAANRSAMSLENTQKTITIGSKAAVSSVQSSEFDEPASSPSSSCTIFDEERSEEYEGFSENAIENDDWEDSDDTGDFSSHLFRRVDFKRNRVPGLSTLSILLQRSRIEEITTNRTSERTSEPVITSLTPQDTRKLMFQNELGWFYRGALLQERQVNSARRKATRKCLNTVDKSWEFNDYNW